MLHARGHNHLGLRGRPQHGTHLLDNVMSYTIRDIAKLAGVSSTTVSRVLNNSENVSHETRTKVQAAISKVHYSPNAYATELRRARCLIQENGEHQRHRLNLADPDLPVSARRDRESQIAMVARLNFIEDENRRLRQLIARLSLDLRKLLTGLSMLPEWRYIDRGAGPAENLRG
jgi:transcriptional regulator with XRE-family HTH domain